jgi:hypothetical protein
MAVVISGLERKNHALMQQHIKTLKADQQKREASGNAEIASACKEAGSWVWHRGRGRKFIVL